MYNAGGYKYSFALEQIVELCNTLQTGLNKQPVVTQANKDKMLKSLKELDDMAKELAVEEQVETKLTEKLNNDSAKARETRNPDILYQRMRDAYKEM